MGEGVECIGNGISYVEKRCGKGIGEGSRPGKVGFGHTKEAKWYNNEQSEEEECYHGHNSENSRWFIRFT